MLINQDCALGYLMSEVWLCAPGVLHPTSQLIISTLVQDGGATPTPTVHAQTISITVSVHTQTRLHKADRHTCCLVSLSQQSNTKKQSNRAGQSRMCMAVKNILKPFSHQRSSPGAARLGAVQIIWDKWIRLRCYFPYLGLVSQSRITEVSWMTELSGNQIWNMDTSKQLFRV